MTINVRCGGVLVGDPFDIPAGSTGTLTKTYDNLPVGTSCIVTEIHDGQTSTVTVEVDGSGQSVTVDAGTTTATITDTYGFVTPGLLVVKKSITGPGAGQQGEVVIQPTCDGTDLTPFTIAAGATGQPSKTYVVAPGSICTITETVDGHTSTVTVTVVGSGQEVTVPGGSSVQAVLTDTYDLAPGSLTVDQDDRRSGGRTTGRRHDQRDLQPEWRRHAAAGLHHRGRSCCRFDLTHLHRHPGRLRLHSHRDRHRRYGYAHHHGHRRQRNPHFRPGRRNRHGRNHGHLRLDARRIDRHEDDHRAGRRAAGRDHHPARRAAAPICLFSASRPERRPASCPRPTSNIPAGTTCTITETGDGENSAVSVVVTGDDQVTVPPGGIVTAERTDTYNLNPGSLIVNKTITGAGAGQQGQITITVTCVNNGVTTTLQPLFIIPAGMRPIPSHRPTPTSPVARCARWSRPRTAPRARWQCSSRAAGRRLRSHRVVPPRPTSATPT